MNTDYGYSAHQRLYRAHLELIIADFPAGMQRLVYSRSKEDNLLVLEYARKVVDSSDWNILVDFIYFAVHISAEDELYHLKY